MKLHHAKAVGWFVLGFLATIGLAAFLLPAVQEVRSPSPRSLSQDHLHNLVIAGLDYEEGSGSLPPAATSIARPAADLHGWQTLLLPHVEESKLYSRIDLDRPWNDPLNQPCFHHQIEVFQNPVVDEREDEKGLALTHYSGNSHVLVAGRPPLTLREVTDGTAYTLGVGEIATRYPPWGRPRNIRDPAIGLHTSPSSFGGPRESKGTQFATLDGHVTYLNADVNPAVLRALATPSGGEHPEP